MKKNVTAAGMGAGGKEHAKAVQFAPAGLNRLYISIHGKTGNLSQQCSFAVIIYMGQDRLMYQLHDPAAIKGILPPDPCDPARERQKPGRDDHKQNSRYKNMEHDK